MANKKRGYYTLKLGGKMRTMHFSMNFWSNFTEQMNISLDKIGDIFVCCMSIKGIRALIYSCVLAHDQEQGNEIEYNVFKGWMWLEYFDSDKLNDVVNAMMQSRILGNDLNMGVARNIKKTSKPTKEGK